MKYGIVALTRGAVKTGALIQSRLKEAVFYVPSALYDTGLPGCALINGNFRDFTAALFRQHRVLIFIMAAGIVVRSIAPCLEHKTRDPAVLVVDEKGRFVISLLSGHIGGANREAERIAGYTGGVPVITTASDVNGKYAVDVLAEKYNCVISDMHKAKALTALIVNDRKVCLLSDFPALCVPEYLQAAPGEAEGIIRISCHRPDTDKKNTVSLFPRLIVAGIGCKKGIAPGLIPAFLKQHFDHLNLDLRCLKSLASITLKAEDLAPAAQALGLPLCLFTKEEIMEVEHMFPGSPFVRRSTGVSCVCEPAAYLGSDRTGALLLTKQVQDGITLALWQETLKEYV